MRSFYLLSIIIVFLSALAPTFAQSNFPQSYTPTREYTGQTIWDIVSVPEENIDVGLWALIIAKEFDSSVDVEKHLIELDEMAVEIRKMIAGRNQDIVKFLMTRMFLYESGIWNDSQPFTYDLDDPLGKKLENQLLSTYLETRKGNCVSMPTLFLALMERIDPNVPFRGVEAPIHLFCRFYDRQTGDIWNVEAANGGNPARNQWYIDKMGITQTAIDSGIYMRDLTKKEFIGELLYTIIAKHREKEDYKKALKYAELCLQLNPKSVIGMVQKGAIMAWLGYNILEGAKVEKRNPTTDEIQKLRRYEIESKKYIESAMILGWRRETPEQREQYLEAVKKEKERIDKFSNN